MKKTLQYSFLFSFFLFISILEAYSQLTFNYDQITICQGDSYDLLKYQTNEVLVPVGWEVVGWKNITNTTVTPTVSPTVYTLQYREKANPATVFTKDLTITLRLKPTVSIAPNGKQNICVGQPINIQKVSAANYDDLYWIYVQKGDNYYNTDVINSIAVRGNIDNKMTYKLIATNNNCAMVAQDEIEYSVTKDDEYPIYMFEISDNSYNNGALSSLPIAYCGTTKIATYMTPTYIVVPANSTGDMSVNPHNLNSLPPNSDYLFIKPDWAQRSENDIVKLTRYEVKWATEDQYTQGGTISGITYSNKYTLEVDLYFKACGTTKTYTYSGELKLNPYCPTYNYKPWISYECSQVKGQAQFGVQNPAGANRINKFVWENLTLPGQYLPHGSDNTYRYAQFDENTPAQMTYRVTIDYIDENGISQRLTFENTFNTCYIKKQISYAPANYDYGFKPWLEYTGYYAPTGAEGRNYEGNTKIDTVETTVCLGSPAYLSIASNVPGSQKVLWRNIERPVLRTQYNQAFRGYNYNFTPDGYKMEIDSFPCYIFKVNPAKTTTYTGTLNGLEFAYKVNVVNNHIAAIDTAICRGQSIDLKTLERIDNINGTVRWNVSNTLVTPTVDTKYTVYGISRDKCPNQTDYTITDNVTVHVDEQLWSTGSTVSSCAGDQMNLKDFLNTNARTFKWFDSSGNQLPDGAIKIAGDTYYTVKMSNGCGTKTETIQVKETPICYDYEFAQNDSLSKGICASTALNGGYPIGFNRFTVSPLLNDGSLCDDPIVSIVKQSSIPDTKAVYSSGKIYYKTSYKNVIDYSGQKDSVQYEVRCEFKKDTAWAYFEIRDEQVLNLSKLKVNAEGSEITLTTSGDSPSKANPISIGLVTADGTSFNELVNLTDTTAYTFKHYPSFPDGKYYYFAYNMSSVCTVEDSVVVRNGQIVQDYVAAVNDSIKLSLCKDSILVNILANDSFNCATPVVKILDSPFSNASIKITDDNKVIYQPDTVHVFSTLGTDSISYSINCNGAIDTAWIFIKYPDKPVIEYTTKFDKSCVSEGDKLVNTISLRNNCDKSVKLDIYYSLVNKAISDYTLDSVKILTATKQIDNIILSNKYLSTVTIDPQSDFITKMYYTIDTVKDAQLYDQTAGIIDANSAFSKLNQQDTLYICPDRRQTITTCSESDTLSLALDSAQSYAITGGTQLPGAIATLSSSGLFKYTVGQLLPDVETDSIFYKITLNNGSEVNGNIAVTVYPCIGEIKTQLKPNDLCNEDTCNYTGPSILINEVIVAPKSNNGSIYGKVCGTTLSDAGGEWVELYNPDKCNSVDISGYFFANATQDKIGNSCTLTRNLGASFVIPDGTVVPPMGFCVLRGEHSQKVDSGYWVENGGNTVVINLVDHFDRFCLNNNGVRFWLPDGAGWFGFYNREGIPQDAVYWGNPADELCSDCLPCNPQISGSFSGQLASLDNIPADRKTKLTNFRYVPVGLSDDPSYQGLSSHRYPDGGVWAYNAPANPTMGYCNGECNFLRSSSCNGTATVFPTDGSGNFSYLWNDANHQTTQTATGLCAGTYCCTITDNNTKLTALACVTVKDNPLLCSPKAVNDTLEDLLCNGSSTIYLPVLTNDRYSCDTPAIALITTPTRSNASVSVEMLSGKPQIKYYIPSATENSYGTDSLQYELNCGSTQKDTAWVFIKIKDGTPKVKDINISSDKIEFKITGGTPKYIYGLAIGDDIPFVTKRSSDSIVSLDSLSLSSAEYYTLWVIDSKRCFVQVDSLQNNKITDTVYFKKTICEGSSYIFYGDTLTLAGTYPKKVSTDTLAILTLQVSSAAPVEVVDSICPRTSYSFNGKSITNAGIYKDTLSTIFGCDSIITLTLLQKAVKQTHQSQHICEGNTYFFGAVNLSASGTYSDTLTSSQGCDSIVTLDLQVNPRRFYAYTDSVCPRSSYTFGTKTLSQPGIYVDTIQSSSACDSIITLTLLQKAVKQTHQIQHICEGNTYSFGGANLSASGTYSDTLTSSQGCDSVLILTLNVKPKMNIRMEKQICFGESYLFEGKNLKTSGIYSKNYNSPNNCDSTLTLYLTVLKPDTSYYTEMIELGEKYLFNGRSLNTSGQYVANYRSVSRCDSVVLLDLIVKSPQEKVYVPVLFTPNDDGDNDYFVIENLSEYPRNSILIFNRWGNKVYEGKPYMNNWDGRNHFGPRVGGDKLPVGTYFYILELGDGSPVKKGYVYLNR